MIRIPIIAAIASVALASAAGNINAQGYSISTYYDQGEGQHIADAMAQHSGAFSAGQNISSLSDLYRWWQDNPQPDILLGVTTYGVKQIIGQNDLHRGDLSIKRIGSFYGAGGKDILILAPDDKRIAVPEIYAVANPNSVSENDLEQAVARLLNQDDHGLAALKAMTGVAARGDAWSSRLRIARYPSATSDDGDGDGDDGCACSGSASTMMTCDPDGLAAQFSSPNYGSGYDGPAISLPRDDNPALYGRVEGDDGCPDCENISWRAVTTASLAQSALLETLGDAGSSNSFSASGRAQAFIDEIQSMPFQSSVIYVMSCDDD